jgi:23S rRNA U2552 (ribose-2'-O)-methylase RlmE/FtsJ
MKHHAPPVFLSQSLCNYMNDIKEKISSREKEWDIYKKYTNPYEYIHSIVPQKKRSVSKYKPISRSYFKMLEMIQTFGLDKPATAKSSSIDLTREKMQTFHLAEGPGGFIEAICNKRNNPDDDYYGMTIIFDEMDDNVPAWHKTGYFLSQHPNVNLEYGADSTGNLLHIQNFEYCVQKYGNTMDLVTADGGFDFSKDFNKQEISISNLLWGQTCYALCLQKFGGNFVLKIFDVFYEQTVNILYILAAFYEEVHVCKLKTSRIGNSEKYVVCKRFRFSSKDEYYPTLLKSFAAIQQTCGESIEIRNPLNIFAENIDWNFHAIDCDVKTPKYIWRILNFDIPRYFTKQIEDINSIFGQQQIENIHYTISLIDKQPKQDKVDQLIRQNITKCVNWCTEHSIPYNNLATTNVFEQGTQSRADCIASLRIHPFELIK